jgi:hypothetical protein
VTGSASVTYDCVFEGVNLGIWVTTQRRTYAVGKLEPERQERLLRLPGWVWDVKAEVWEDRFSRLARYVQDTGTAEIPVSYVDESGCAVGQWVLNQRAFGRKGKLSAYRRSRLEALPGWVWHSKDATWENWFSSLQKYVAKQGNATVPGPYTVDGAALGQWVTSQRAAASKGSLDPDRYRRLDALPGWVWDTWDAQWESAFSSLLAYVAREGTSLVPQSHREDGFTLGGWVTQQRGKRAKGKLSAERQRRLEELPG